MACNTGAIRSAVEFQVGPGAHGAATAFPVGISFNAATRSWMVKGTPVGGPGVGMVSGSPFQVSRTKATSMLLSSDGVMRCPSSLRSWSLLFGVLGECRLMRSNSLCVSCAVAAFVASCRSSWNFMRLRLLANLRWWRLKARNRHT